MPDHAADIRALRKQSNAAIAALDAQYVVSFMHDEVVVRVAGGPVLQGRAANCAAFAQQMAEPGFGGYVRTPEQIIVEQPPLRATERGHWRGFWRVRGRLQEQRGPYVAEWQHTEFGWVIMSETYSA